jgi:hypothetical protein
MSDSAVRGLSSRHAHHGSCRSLPANAALSFSPEQKLSTGALPSVASGRPLHISCEFCCGLAQGSLRQVYGIRLIASVDAQAGAAGTFGTGGDNRQRCRAIQTDLVLQPVSCPRDWLQPKPRSRRPRKGAKDSGHYPSTLCRPETSRKLTASAIWGLRTCSASSRSAMVRATRRTRW